MELEIAVDLNEPVPIYKQISDQIREQILSCRLAAGQRLPSSRDLSRALGVARVSITTAYNQLVVEGFVTSKVGSGTFVSDNICLETLSHGNRTEPALNLSAWGQRILSDDAVSLGADNNDRPSIDFGFGRSFPHIFPYDIWRRLLARYLSTDDTMLSRYGSAAGFDPLRSAVASYLRRLRGVHCTMDQVVIVNGIQQALDIICRLLLVGGDAILVESPGYADAYRIFQMFGADLRPMAVDSEGFPVELIDDSMQAKLTFVTPSNQFPRGGTLPLERRLALLDWAQKSDGFILEDDYDGELRYSSHPITALQGLDRTGRVIYLGTFSKVLFPALRLGYLVLPVSILPVFLKAKELVDRGAPTLTQAAVADFINEGHFERHLRRLRNEYGRRRRTLVQALDNHLNNLVEYSNVEAGLHIMLYLPVDLDESHIVLSARSAGVGVYPGSAYHLHKPERPSILLGFSGLRSSEIREGVERLADVIKRS